MSDIYKHTHTYICTYLHRLSQNEISFKMGLKPSILPVFVLHNLLMLMSSRIAMSRCKTLRNSSHFVLAWIFKVPKFKNKLTSLTFY